VAHTRYRSASALKPLPPGLPRVPRAIMRASREPFASQLEVRCGQLPQDLYGHMFIMVPSGSVTDGRESGPGSPLLGGDGMFYRLDFDRPGEAHLKTRLAGPPCFYADRATSESRKHSYTRMHFDQLGIGRLSPLLGMRNMLNTAFLPMRFGPDQHERLLVTTDDGRPYEIDPHSLRTVTPVGKLTEWRELIGAGVRVGPWTFGSFPFPLVMSTAHPVFDQHSQELFTVNYGRSPSTLFATITTTVQDVETLGDAWRLLRHKGYKLLLFVILALPLWLMGLWQRLWHGANNDNFTYLLRWRGDGDLERWSLTLPDGSPLTIRQTLHQMAVTRDYIVLIDASFKFSPDQLFNTIHPFHRDNKLLERFIRDLLTGPQMPETLLYIVRRSDLEAGQRPARPGEQGAPPAVMARQLAIPPEALHFLADYDNPHGQITLYLAHGSAACLAEWLREYDQSAYPPHDLVSRDLLGLIAVGQMDISRLGRYVIDGERGALQDARLVSSFVPPETFNIGLYAYRDNPAPQRLDTIYWMAGGFWPELLTSFIHDTYKNYRNRVIPLDEFQRITGNFKPTGLLRLNTQTMQLADWFGFPTTHVGLSPQFVPRRRDTPPDSTVDLSTDGYIVCTVVSGDDCSEFWIFDAADLKRPVCVLGHDRLRFGLTIHTSWMAQALPRDATYRVSARADFERRVRATGNCTMVKLFERYVYPYCDGDG